MELLYGLRVRKHAKLKNKNVLHDCSKYHMQIVIARTVSTLRTSLWQFLVTSAKVNVHNNYNDFHSDSRTTQHS